MVRSTPSISDYALVRRQFHIFERALKKFKSDVGLWIQYIELAKKEGARSLVGRISARFVVIFMLLNMMHGDAHTTLPSERCSYIPMYHLYISWRLHMSFLTSHPPLQGHYYNAAFG